MLAELERPINSQEEPNPENMLRTSYSVIDKYLAVMDHSLEQYKFIDWIHEQWQAVAAVARAERFSESFEHVDRSFKETRGPNFIDKKAVFSPNGELEAVDLQQLPAEGRHVRASLIVDRKDPTKLERLLVIDETHLPEDENVDDFSLLQSHSVRRELRLFFHDGKLYSDYQVNQHTKDLFDGDDRPNPNAWKGWVNS